MAHQEQVGGGHARELVNTDFFETKLGGSRSVRYILSIPSGITLTALARAALALSGFLSKTGDRTLKTSFFAKHSARHVQYNSSTWCVKYCEKDLVFNMPSPILIRETEQQD